MSFMHCIFAVLFFAVGEAQILGETTHYGRNDPVMLRNAHEALFSSDLKQESGVFHKLLELEESSTMGILTTMKVVMQDTDCPVSFVYSSYYDVLHYCHGKGRRKYCTLEYRYRTPSTATLSECFEEVEEPLIVPQRVQRVNGRTIYIDPTADVEEQIVPQRSQMLGGTTRYNDSNVRVKEEVKQAIFESDKKKSSGTYLLLDKILDGLNMGISSRFQVLVKETECNIKEKAYDSYKDVYANCSGSGDSKVCSVEYKYFDPTKSTVEC
ncbi:hypothetical protein T03_17187 [Trichinella britovi]|uniref:Uncharacterized protein n=1 Tax=Trichinella britovi TaxID=45882 RepID=A0A0V1CLN1_TRIBR|nr:hypothetical protein T03_17187 [Trichinella britovi]